MSQSECMTESKSEEWLTFSTQKNKHFKFINDAAAKILINYDWKGNIRELKNIIERAVLIYDDDTLKPDHFASNLNIVYNETLEDDVLKINLRSDSFDYKDLEKQIITKLLSHFKGNKSKTAKYLNITRNRLNRKLL